MDDKSPMSLIQLLRSNELTIRTGLLLLPLYALGHESEIAAHFGIGHQDICDWLISKTPAGRSSLGLNSHLILDALTQIITDQTIPGKCVLISNVDILVAGVDFQNRTHLLSFLKNNFRRSRGMLLSFPETAHNILPIEQRDIWKSVERLAIWTGEDGCEP